MQSTKIATCCYCGMKAALVLRGKTHHELSCSSCGAPLQAMKMLPTGYEGVTKSDLKDTRRRSKVKPKTKVLKQFKRKKKFNKRKGFGQKLWAEFWDEIEDIFD